MKSLDFATLEKKIVRQGGLGKHLGRNLGKDLHLEDAKIIYGKENISADERRMVKTLNFLSTYN